MTNLAKVRWRKRKERAMISHRVCAFGCYIVCALLFQRFLENDHHVSAHAAPVASLLLQEGGTVGPSRLVQCSATVHFSRNALLILHGHKI